MEYRQGSPTVFKIQYHFVFVTKYRYKVLKGDVGLKVRKLIRQTCEAFEIEILKGVISQDHVHVLVSAPPNMAPSKIVRRIKGRSAAKLFENFPELKKRYWERHFWASLQRLLLSPMRLMICLCPLGSIPSNNNCLASSRFSRACFRLVTGYIPIANILRLI